MRRARWRSREQSAPCRRSGEAGRLERRLLGPLVLSVFTLASQGCGVVRNDTTDPCTYAEADSYAACDDAPATSSDTSDATDCAGVGGTCVEVAPDGWSGPHLYWIGPPSAKPPCPTVAPLAGSEAYADLQVLTHTCPTCDCGPSETVCSPSSKWTVRAGKCAEEDAPATSFDVLARAWDGTCNTDNPIAADADCNGVPCTQSVTVEAPEAVGAPCTAITIGTEVREGPPWPWSKMAKECLVSPTDSCSGQEGRVCVPASDDFLACVSLDHAGHDGNVACPPFYNDEVHQMYRDVEDTRACTSCTCGPPTGAECSITASAYSDTDCSDFTVGGVIFSTDGQACFDLPSGTPLGSKSAEVKLTVAGTCALEGGESTGAVTPVRRVTLCCHREVAK